MHTTPYLLGVTDDLAKAQRLTEPHLISGQAFVCLIETVRAAFTVHGMDSCYVRPGPDWLGRLTTSGQVRWHESVPGAGPANALRLDARPALGGRTLSLNARFSRIA